MTDTNTKPDEKGAELKGEELRARVNGLIDALLREERGQAEKDFEHMLSRAKELVRRKQSMEGTKRETKDLLSEILFTRLRRAMREFVSNDDAGSELRTAEWVMGVLYSSTSLMEFSRILDLAILESARPSDYSFAGRADFISLEEVLQLLSSGSYTGKLAIEKDDNRLDIYLDRGEVAFLDPHHLLRRVIPSEDALQFREIPPDKMQQAEALHAEKGMPLIMGLVSLGVFEEGQITEATRNFGLEVLFEFLREQRACSFFYRKMPKVPVFAERHHLHLQVTPILLEGSKRNDDWASLVRAFPDPTEPIRPVEDMFARINGLDLNPLEIKMLAMINGETSPRDLVPAIGLPLSEVYQTLVKFAKEGVLNPPGGLEAITDVGFSVEESMQMAFEALDANDDKAQLANALDAILGDDEEGEADSAEGEGETFLDRLANLDGGNS